MGGAGDRPSDRPFTRSSAEKHSSGLTFASKAGVCKPRSSWKLYIQSKNQETSERKQTHDPLNFSMIDGPADGRSDVVPSVYSCKWMLMKARRAKLSGGHVNSGAGN